MAKVRIYELAHRLGVESELLMSWLGEMGDFVSSQWSAIEAPVVRRLEERFAAYRAPVNDVEEALAANRVPVNDTGSAEKFLAAIDETIRYFNDGDIILGTVVQIDRDKVLVDLGCKTEGVIPAGELSADRYLEPPAVVRLGEQIEALVLQKEGRQPGPLDPVQEAGSARGDRRQNRDRRGQPHPGEQPGRARATLAPGRASQRGSRTRENVRASRQLGFAAEAGTSGPRSDRLSRRAKRPAASSDLPAP